MNNEETLLNIIRKNGGSCFPYELFKHAENLTVKEFLKTVISLQNQGKIKSDYKAKRFLDSNGLYMYYYLHCYKITEQ